MRLKVTFEGEEFSIDLGVDYRLFPVVDTDEGLLIHEHDLVGDKMLAFCRRRQPRDLHDLIALETRHGLTELCRLANIKELMFKPVRFNQALEVIAADPRFAAHGVVIERWRNAIPLLPPVREETDFGIDF